MRIFFKNPVFFKSFLIFEFIFFILLLHNSNNHSFKFFNEINKNPIKIAFYNSINRYGGIERVTSILLTYFQKEKSFKFYLITLSGILKEEYSIPNNIERICLNDNKNKLFSVINKRNINILVYSRYDIEEIHKLNKLNELKKTKVIFWINASFLYKIYEHFYSLEQTVYKEYKNCKYVVSLVPFENDYLFKKWGINSVLIENPSTFEYESIIPSDLSQKNIIMIGRGDCPQKRFDLGIKAMAFIIREIPESKMFILSKPANNLNVSIHNLSMENNIKIISFQKNIEIYLKNSSLHIFPSLSESYSMVLSEVKIFGIPTILCGIDYVILAKGGTVIIYDDNPATIAKEAIKILKNYKYRKKLGNEARNSMKKIGNKLIIKKWIKLFLSIYKGIDKSSYSNIFNNYTKRITEKEANIILNNQLKLIKMRIPALKGITLEKLKSFSLK